MEHISFTKGSWEDRLVHAYTTRMSYTPRLVQEADCVRNGTDERSADGYDYTTVITGRMYGAGTRLTLVCEFDNYGAPLFTFTDKVWRDDAGELRYSDCFEVVLWESGINVWQLCETDGKTTPIKLFYSTFPVTAGQVHSMQVRILESCLEVIVGERTYGVYIPDLPKEMYVGVTACEAINRLYSLTIED